MAVTIPPLSLGDLPQGQAIVDSRGFPTDVLLRTINGNTAQIKRSFSAITDTVNRLRRLLSHTEPTTILSATENGTNCTIAVLPHARVYADATSLNISGASVPGLACATWYACYYDDMTLSDASPDFQFTTDLAEAQAARAEGRHFCGLIKTPGAGTGETIESGGAYPIGAAAVSGELEL